MTLSSRTTTVLLFFSIVVGAAFVVLIARWEPSPEPGLTAEEAAADARQLRLLLAATGVDPGSLRALQVTYFPATPCGGYRGLLVSGPWRRDGSRAAGEELLAVDLLARRKRLFASPGRPPLPALSFRRDDFASHLVTRGSGRLLRWRLLDPPASEPGSELLAELDNRRRGGRTGAELVGRRFAALAPLHCKLTRADLELCELLGRTVRVRLRRAGAAAPGTERAPSVDAGVVIYRAAGRDRFRIETGALSAPGDRVVVEVRRNGDGRLGLELLGRQGGTPRGSELAATIHFLPPAEPGTTPRFDHPAAVELAIPADEIGARGAPGGARLELDLAALLAETSWLRSR